MKKLVISMVWKKEVSLNEFLEDYFDRMLGDGETLTRYDLLENNRGVKVYYRKKGRDESMVFSWNDILDDTFDSHDFYDIYDSFDSQEWKSEIKNG